MYKPMEAQVRADNLKALNFQLDALELLADAEGPWLAGPLSGADAAVRSGCSLRVICMKKFGFLFGYHTPPQFNPLHFTSSQTIRDDFAVSSIRCFQP